MYEIPFLSKGVIDGGGMLHTVRVIELTKVAQTLAAAGWPVHWSIAGLAFDVPPEIRRSPKEERDPAAIRQKLAALGIEDEFRIGSSRSWTEVIVAKHECRDKVWYANVDHDLRNPPEFDPDFRCCCDDGDDTQLLELMKETEELYGRKELIVETDYARGALNGRQEALDWLFGEEWPELEPEDEWEAEEAEMERSFMREEQAVEGFHKVLFGEQAVPAVEPDQPPQLQPELAVHPGPDATAAAKSKAGVAEAMARLSARKLEQQGTAQPSVN